MNAIDILTGDSRAILPTVTGDHDLLYLDPPWLGATVPLIGSDDPISLTRAAIDAAPTSVKRVVLHLGCDTDPRMLAAVPARWPFLRVCWLRFARPAYKGRLLNGSEVAYVFGEPPASRDGARVLPGETPTVGEVVSVRSSDGRMSPTPSRHHRSRKWESGHPCPRRQEHVAWILRWFCTRGVIDPFCGSGTTLLAARSLQLAAVGIEADAEFARIARRRLADYEPLLGSAPTVAQQIEMLP